MEIHGLAFGVVAVFRYSPAARAKLIIGINRAITGNKLDRLVRTK